MITIITKNSIITRENLDKQINKQIKSFGCYQTRNNRIGISFVSHRFPVAFHPSKFPVAKSRVQCVRTMPSSPASGTARAHTPTTLQLRKKIIASRRRGTSARFDFSPPKRIFSLAFCSSIGRQMRSYSEEKRRTDRGPVGGSGTEELVVRSAGSWRLWSTKGAEPRRERGMVETWRRVPQESRFSIGVESLEYTRVTWLTDDALLSVICFDNCFTQCFVLRQCYVRSVKHVLPLTILCRKIFCCEVLQESWQTGDSKYFWRTYVLHATPRDFDITNASSTGGHGPTSDAVHGLAF